ncbi:MAG: LPS export ABC transporter permease LptF [Desulfobacteraceae bacterium]|nr:MAG: LPS export ABC transporter permease LptF [Desulfobacteraceae bacterium]
MVAITKGESSLFLNRLLYFLSCGAMFVMALGTSPFTILGSCMVAAWVFSGEFLRGRRVYLSLPWFLPVCLMVILAWVSLIWSHDRELGVDYASKSYYWLYALAIAGAAPMIRGREHIVKAFLGGLLLNATAAFLQAATLLPRFSKWGAKGYTGFYGGYNTLGILLVLGILVASFYLRPGVPTKRRIAAGCLTAVYFIHLMILESRGAYLTFFILSPLLFYNVIGRKSRLWIILACIVAAAVLYSSPIVRDRINKAGEDIQYHFSSSNGDEWGKQYSERLDRLYMWRWALTVISEHPLLGVGAGGYRKAVLSAGGEVGVDHPHNNFLHVGSSYGIGGLFLLGWLFWILLKTGWVNRNEPIGFLVLASSLVLLVGGLTDTHVLDSGGAFLFALTTGLQTAAGKENGGAHPAGSAAYKRVPLSTPFKSKILYRYLFYEIWPTLFASLVVFIFIVLAARMLNISEWVVNHGVHIGDVGKMIIFLLPGMILFALPAAILMAVFIAFLRLSGDNEIMALKSSGISLFQMLPPVITVSIVGFLAALTISTLVVPWGNRSFRDLVFRIAKSKANLGIKERVFSEPFDKVTFYVNSFSPKENMMKDIFLVDRREPSMTTTIVSKSGMIVSDPEGRAIVIHLMDGTVFTTEKKGEAARTIRFSTYDVRIGLEDIMPPDSPRRKSPKEMSILEMTRFLRTSAEKKTEYHEVAVELMERISIPFAVFLMGMIGAPLGAQIRSGGRSLGIGISMAIFLVYYLFLAGVRGIGETGTLSPFIGMWLPSFFLLVSTLLLLNRVQNEKSLIRWGKA